MKSWKSFKQIKYMWWQRKGYIKEMRERNKKQAKINSNFVIYELISGRFKATKMHFFSQNMFVHDNNTSWLSKTVDRKFYLLTGESGFQLFCIQVLFHLTFASFTTWCQTSLRHDVRPVYGTSKFLKQLHHCLEMKYTIILIS